MRTGARIAAAAAAAAMLGGCELPRDPNGTLERIGDGTMRVGVTDNEPWVTQAGEPLPGGVEPELVRRLARRLRARIEWVHGSEAALVEALAEGELDLVLGGLERTSPWQKEAALTRPYVTTRVVVGAPPAMRGADDLDGVAVAYERGSEVGGLLRRKTGAAPRPVDDLRDARGPAAVDDWMLDDLGLRATGVELSRHDHVMAAPLGENAWLMRLERFLRERKADIRALLEREGRR